MTALADHEWAARLLTGSALQIDAEETAEGVA